VPLSVQWRPLNDVIVSLCVCVCVRVCVCVCLSAVEFVSEPRVSNSTEHGQQLRHIIIIIIIKSVITRCDSENTAQCQLLSSAVSSAH